MRSFIVMSVMLFTLCTALLGLVELRRGEASASVFALGAGMMFVVGALIAVW